MENIILSRRTTPHVPEPEGFVQRFAGANSVHSDEPGLWPGENVEFSSKLLYISHGRRPQQSKATRKRLGSFIASIMTLMMVELCLSICDPVWLLHALKFCQIYGGNSKSWRAHFDGAWNFLKAQQAVQPWATPTFADSST